jgi:hypothetical protein
MLFQLLPDVFAVVDRDFTHDLLHVPPRAILRKRKKNFKEIPDSDENALTA